MYTGLRVKHALLLPDLNETCIFWTDFRKIHIEFHADPSSGNRAVPWGHKGNSRFPQFCKCA